MPVGACLIIANQTVGGIALREAISARIERGRTDFYILVPMIEPAAETGRWAPNLTPLGLSTAVAADVASKNEAERRSRHRLNWLVAWIRDAGGQADGIVGPPDPVTGTRRLLVNHDFEEIVLSTLPAGLSRWIRMDVAARLRRLTDVPVSPIEARPLPSPVP